MARVAESTESTENTDRWHRWLLDRRFGGDAAFRERELTGFLYPIRDTVLDKARLRPGDTLLDVGTGDGMIAFGALERLGPEGRVIFSDISSDLLPSGCFRSMAEAFVGRFRSGFWSGWRRSSRKLKAGRLYFATGLI